MAQLVVRNDENTDVDMAIGQRIAEMADVHDQQVASCRHLNLDTDAHTSAVDCMTFRPVDGAALLDQPSAGLRKAFIEDLANGGPAVRVLCLLHEQLKSSE